MVEVTLPKPQGRPMGVVCTGGGHRAGPCGASYERAGPWGAGYGWAGP